MLLDQVTGSRPVDDVLSVGNFSADFRQKDAQANRVVSSISNDMWQDFYGILTDLKSKVDLLSSAQVAESKPNSGRQAAPGPDSQKHSSKGTEKPKDDGEDSDYKDDFESTFKNSESGFHIESSLGVPRRTNTQPSAMTADEEEEDRLLMEARQQH